MDPDAGIWVFSYRFGPTNSTDDHRWIAPEVHEAMMQHLQKVVTVVDRKGNMVLFADLGAKVR
jgi:hypothetical protein